MYYPTGAEYYLLHEEIGNGATATVHRALCIPLNQMVAVKIIDLEGKTLDLNDIVRESHTSVMMDHPNVLKSLCSFVVDVHLWVVMPYMAAGSCRKILESRFPGGFEDEAFIATLLYEVLKALAHLHDHGFIHRDVKAQNVLIDSEGSVKLGDFGISACMIDSGERKQKRSTFHGTLCWVAPEVIGHGGEDDGGYDYKADIWSFGITALELAQGHTPLSMYRDPMKILLMILESPSPTLDPVKAKKYSKSFKHMIDHCLVKDPSKRPSAKHLLKHDFFRSHAKSSDYIARNLGLKKSEEVFHWIRKKHGIRCLFKKNVRPERPMASLGC